MNNVLNIIKKTNKFDYIFSSIFTIIFYIGNLIFYNNKFNIFILLSIYIVIFILLLIIKNTYLFLRKYNIKSKHTFNKKNILLMMIPLIVIYLICYLGYFPGTFSYDISAVNNMVTQKMVLSNVNPIIYTFLWGFCYKLELLTNINNFRIIIYTIIQLSFIMFTHYYLLKWLINNKYNKTIILIVYLYILLNPILHIMSIITSKDIIVSYLFILFLITYININKNMNKKYCLILFILGLLCLLFTNSFIAPMILIFILLFFYQRKISLIILNCILTYSFILILLPIFNIRYTQTQEMLSVPIVQMSYVYNKTNTYTPKEKELIKSIIPNIEYYNPRIVDKTKTNFKYYQNNTLKIFWRMYYKGLKSNKINYIKTFLNLNIRIWYPKLNNYDSYVQRPFIEDDLYLNNNYKNIIYKYYHKLSSTNIISKIPLLNIFLSFAFPFYFLITSLYLYKIKKYNKNFFITNIFVLFYLISYIVLAPVTYFRYIFYFYVSFPLLLIGILTKDERNKYEKI